MSDFGHIIITKAGIDDLGDGVFEKIEEFFKTQDRVVLINSRNRLDADYHTIDILSVDANYMDWRTLLVLIYKNKDLFELPENVFLLLKISEECEMIVLTLSMLFNFIDADYLEDDVQHMWDDDLKLEWENERK